jgi:hypothetical protein
MEDAGIVAISALSGMVIGAVIGGLIKTEQWEEVPLPSAAPRGPPAVARY